jgi:hypothetical protein
MGHAAAPGGETVFGFGVHSTIDDGPRLLAWGGEIVPAIREATARQEA